MSGIWATNHSFLRLFGGALLILSAWMGVGSLLTLSLLERWQVTFFTGSALLLYLALHAGFLCFAGGLAGVLVGLNRLPWSVLLCPGGRPWRMQAFWQTLLVWMGLLLLGVGLEVWRFPGSVVFQGLVPDWYFWLLAIALLTPLQVWAEERFFRVYLPSLLLKGLYPHQTALNRPSPWHISLAVVLSALAFAGVHLQNPELTRPDAWLVVGYYLLYAMLASLLVLWEQGLERVLAWHLGTNLFAFLFLSYDLAAIRTPALFHSSRFDPAWNLAQFALLSLLGCGILYLSNAKERET